MKIYFKSIIVVLSLLGIFILNSMVVFENKRSEGIVALLEYKDGPSGSYIKHIINPSASITVEFNEKAQYVMYSLYRKCYKVWHVSTSDEFRKLNKKYLVRGDMDVCSECLVEDLPTGLASIDKETQELKEEKKEEPKK